MSDAGVGDTACRRAMSDEIERFEIHVDDAVLGDLHDRLARTRFPDQVEGTGWEYGIPIDLPARARRVLARRVRLARAGGTAQRARALPHAHRRPVDPLHPRALGARGRVAVAHHARLARLGRRVPGGHPAADGPRGSRRPGERRLPRGRALTPRLRLLGAHPHARLGSMADRAGVHRADGSARLPALRRAGRRLGCPGRDEDRRARHRPLRGDPPQHGDRRPARRARAARTSRSPTRTRPTSPPCSSFAARGVGYALEQSTKPQTVGVGLNDSPAGLLAWIVEKFRTWSDCDGDPENVFTRDQLITNVMTYWVTQTITSSARLYWEHQHTGEPAPGASTSRPESRAIPRRSSASRGHGSSSATTSRTGPTMPRGGHFAAMEQPELFVDDLRTFFRTVR